ncbi:hypothetical protein ACFP1I_09330 [Dyadobacter subterraneus]|uniref:DUF4340 domain-containing protein n=1 Tax=Dyadobacter subterraneus TaxID=2773304 RepID=A0ABR9WB57_9BACT|nr:hypothetical protein [Dyadobacter subterraneus]MBE9462697.1 hypothetical protein [Dyadobacter subterraneus]
MKNLNPKYKRILLLLIIAVAAWLVYNPKRSRLLETKPSAHTLTPEKQLDISGKVIEYGSNHDGDIDKILLSIDTGNVWLHFPPHTARQVTSVARIEHFITASVRKGGPPGHHFNSEYELKYLRSQFSDTILDLSRLPAPLPSRGFEVAFKGKPNKISGLGNADNTGFVLAGKRIVLPPHMAKELIPLISRAKIVLVKGQMRDSTQGFMSATGLNVVKPSSIQIDSVIYKVR